MFSFHCSCLGTQYLKASFKVDSAVQSESRNHGRWGLRLEGALQLCLDLVCQDKDVFFPRNDLNFSIVKIFFL